MSEAARYCPVCGAPRAFVRLYEVRRFGIAKCSSCGVGATELPAGFDPNSIYTQAYFEGGHDDGYAGYSGSQETLRAEFRSVVQALKQVSKPGGKLLEVGCAYGYFLLEARASFEVVGVEVSEHAAEQARGAGLDVTTGALSQRLLDSKGPFDVAVMLDVIEHLDRPDEVISLVHRGLKPGSTLVLTTGDWSSVISKVMGARWRLMTPPQHLFFFDPTTIQSMLARLGFEVTSVSHPWKRVPVELILYQLARYARAQRFAKRLPVPAVGIPINLFDAMRVVAVRK